MGGSAGGYNGNMGMPNNTPVGGLGQVNSQFANRVGMNNMDDAGGLGGLSNKAQNAFMDWGRTGQAGDYSDEVNKEVTDWYGGLGAQGQQNIMQGHQSWQDQNQQMQSMGGLGGGKGGMGNGGGQTNMLDYTKQTPIPQTPTQSTPVAPGVSNLESRGGVTNLFQSMGV